MQIPIFMAVALLSVNFISSTFATEATRNAPSKVATGPVAKLQAAYADTFDRRDANGMAALFTESATLQNESGDIVQGRGRIEFVLMRLMGDLPPGATLKDTALAWHTAAADVIVSQGTSQRLSANAAPAQMFFTRVLVRCGDQWQLAATQIARPSTAPKPGTAPK